MANDTFSLQQSGFMKEKLHRKFKRIQGFQGRRMQRLFHCSRSRLAGFNSQEARIIEHVPEFQRGATVNLQ